MVEDIQSIIAQSNIDTSPPPGRTSKSPEGEQGEPNKVEETASIGNEKNYTDPKVCHDPSIKLEGIARIFFDQNKFHMENGEDISMINAEDSIRVDGIEYPLIVVNNRNIERGDINYFKINYDSFLPTILLEIDDIHQNEQKINTTQMSGMIRVCMVAPLDKIYKKILLNFRITNVDINENNPTKVTYSGEYYVENFKQVTTQLIYMPNVCPSAPNCLQGGHINANTWEMLHRISELTGLGFAATKKCKEIEDRVVRHIHTQRFNEFIEDQLAYSGLGEDNIFDAWVDLYGYIVMVNVKWVMDEKIMPSDLVINSIVGAHATSNNLPDEEPVEVQRTITNYNVIQIQTDIEIKTYNMIVNNESILDGTLERIYKMNIGGTKTHIETLEIQTKQDSVDGDFIEDYNTGKNRPIPKFNFNDPAYTGLSGGYNLDEQKKIRNAYFKKKRQSLLIVTLKKPNFGLQRGTLVNVAIYDDDPINKQVVFQNSSNLNRNDSNAEADKINLPEEYNQYDVLLDSTMTLMNMKLSGLYYIDGMTWEYSPAMGSILQSLILIKKGKTTGYLNKHNATKMVKLPERTTLPQTSMKVTEDAI